MLKIYFSSIVIYFIILTISFKLVAEMLDSDKKEIIGKIKKGKKVTLLFISFIPIIRTFILIYLWYILVMPIEEFKKQFDKDK